MTKEESINNLQGADVVERSKIDKAIEEIEDLDNAKYGFESYYQCKAEVLEILKRNIGEWDNDTSTEKS